MTSLTYHYLVKAKVLYKALRASTEKPKNFANMEKEGMITE